MVNFQSFTRIAAIGTALAAGLLAMAQKPALAQTNGSWSATTGGSWGTASNWGASQIAGGVSGSANFSSAIAGGINTVTLDGDRTIGAIRLGSGASANIFSLQMGTSGTLTLATNSGSPILDVQTSRSGIIGASLAGSQGFVKSGAGTLYLGGNSTYSGTTTVNLGTLELTTPNSFGVSGAGNETVVNGNAPARVRIGGTTSTAESFIISGTGASNTGAINFGSSATGVNTTGTITGQITLSADAQIGAAANSSGMLDRLTAGNAIDNAGFNLTYVGAGSLQVNSPIVGNGSFTHNGSGNVTLTAVNTYTGTTGWGSATGTLFLGDGGTGGSLSTSSAITLTNPNSTFAVNQSDTVTQGTDFSGSAINGNGKFTQAGSGTTILTAANSFTGATTISAGALQLGNAGTTGGLSASSAISTSSGARLIVNRTNAATQGTDFSTAAITGDGGFIQAGSGTTILNAANSYLGATSVNAGTLRINGDQSGATGAVTVAAGATLGGSGTVGGNTTITGIHSPGNSPGIQTFNGNLTYEAGAVVNWELIANSAGSAGTNYDQIVLPTTGNLTFNGSTTLALSFNGAGSAVDWSNTFWNVNRSWMVYDLSSGVVSNAGNLVLGGSLLDSLGNSLSPTGRGYFTTSLSGQDVMLNFVAVPEPSTLVLLSGLAVGGFLLRRRRA